MGRPSDRWDTYWVVCGSQYEHLKSMPFQKYIQTATTLVPIRLIPTFILQDSKKGRGQRHPTRKYRACAGHMTFLDATQNAGLQVASDWWFLKTSHWSTAVHLSSLPFLYEPPWRPFSTVGLGVQAWEQNYFRKHFLEQVIVPVSITTP